MREIKIKHFPDTDSLAIDLGLQEETGENKHTRIGEDVLVWSDEENRICYIEIMFGASRYDLSTLKGLPIFEEYRDE